MSIRTATGTPRIRNSRKYNGITSMIILDTSVDTSPGIGITKSTPASEDSVTAVIRVVKATVIRNPAMTNKIGRRNLEPPLAILAQGIG